MRRTWGGAALAVLAVLAASLPATAKEKPQRIGGQTLLVGYGSAAADVTIPKGVSLYVRAPAGDTSYGFATVLNPGTWSAYALVSRTARHAGRPVSAVQVHMPYPDHCASSDVPVGTAPPCEARVEQSFVNAPEPTVAGPWLRYALPAGTYQFVVSGPRNAFVGAVLQFGGVVGVRAVVARRPVAASFERTREENIALAHVTGSFDHKLTANGIGVLGVWHTATGEEPGEFTYAECVTPGVAGPFNPDDCLALGASGASPPAGGHKPVFFAASTGGFTLTPSGNGTWMTPVLKKGTYTNTFRVTRGGRGPAAGAFAWWLQADSLK